MTALARLQGGGGEHANGHARVHMPGKGGDGWRAAQQRAYQSPQITSLAGPNAHAAPRPPSINRPPGKPCLAPGMDTIRLVCAEGRSPVNGSLHPTGGADCAYLPKDGARGVPTLFISDKLAGASLVIAENETHLIVAHVHTKAEVVHSGSPPANMIDMLCKEQVGARGLHSGRGKASHTRAPGGPGAPCVDAPPSNTTDMMCKEQVGGADAAHRRVCA